MTGLPYPVSSLVSLESAQLNEGPVSVMAGVRYFDLDEQLVIRGVDSNTGASNYGIGARNDLKGGQIGDDLLRLVLVPLLGRYRKSPPPLGH